MPSFCKILKKECYTVTGVPLVNGVYNMPEDNPKNSADNNIKGAWIGAIAIVVAALIGTFSYLIPRGRAASHISDVWPGGGIKNSIKIGEPNTITWNPGNGKGLVTILISKTDPNKFQLVEAGVPNTGKYTWTPDVSSGSRHAIFRIESTTNPEVNAVSSSSFFVETK